MAHLTLIPAYGRDYSSRAEAVADWLADKDFEDASWDATGRYVNRPQVADGETVIIRFKRATQLVTFRKGSEPKPRKRGAGKARPRFYSVTAFDAASGASLMAPFRRSTKAEAIRWARSLSDRGPGAAGAALDAGRGSGDCLPGEGPVETMVLAHREAGKPSQIARYRAGKPVKG